MSQHVKSFEDRLAGLFERKAEEFSRYSTEQSSANVVARQLADLYKDLANMMRRQKTNTFTSS